VENAAKSRPFFVLVHRLEGDAVTEYVTDDASHFGDLPRCRVCNNVVGMRSWLPPFRVELETWGTQFGDLCFGSGCDILVSQRFKQAYDARGLTGLSGFERVEIMKTTRHQKFEGAGPAYLKGTVFRGTTAIDPLASGVEWEDDVVCQWCLVGTKLKRRRRIVIDEETWTGEDIFFARGLPGQIIASNRFKEVCDANRITNAFLVPAVHRR
jgi:hypothetical protein